MAYIDNLVAWWSMDEVSGIRADATGSHDLTDVNTVGSASGVVGNAAQFVAANQEYLSHTSNSELRTGDIDFSLLLWLKLTTAGGWVLMSKDIDTPGSHRDYTLDLDSGSPFPRFYVNGGAAGIASWGSNLSTGVFYMIAAGHSAASDLMWISVDAQTPVTASTGGAVPDASTAEFRIGARAYSGFEGYTNGLIDEAALFKRDIRSDLSWFYNGGSGRSYADVLASVRRYLPVNA